MKAPLARLLLMVATLPALVPSPGFATESAKAKAQEETQAIELPKMKVKGTPVCSFGIGIVYSRDSVTLRIKRVFISEVSPNTEAARLGLKPQDEILAINGVKVSTMDGSMKPGAHLFDLLVNQAPGKSISLEVAVYTVNTFSLTAIPPNALF